jgi:hypothetical protein
MLDPVLGAWSRGALAVPDDHHVSVLTSAVSQIACIHNETAGSNKVKKLIRKMIFRNKGDEQGFKELRADLDRVMLSRNDILASAVANTVMLQLHLLSARSMARKLQQEYSRKRGTSKHSQLP